jgi:hypothetical protein
MQRHVALSVNDTFASRRLERGKQERKGAKEKEREGRKQKVIGR